jgi:hypothetical protein
MRDSDTPVGTFALGFVPTTNQTEIWLPLSLVSVDTPQIGIHDYKIQVRYVGDEVDSISGSLDIRKAKFIAASF